MGKKTADKATAATADKATAETATTGLLLSLAAFATRIMLSSAWNEWSPWCGEADIDKGPATTCMDNCRSSAKDKPAI
ncbi:hypothetical protein OsI_13008 [Oryza sativa Indica Group]|uniref:Uncharacterized protein n=1 Tax=Oryza sativa subsp. indica TaxID=39946 RepID=B8APL2_ORYSI|nr:hypothetical protein OsI_13008 [Oryza sativa Indica Group]